MQGERIATAAGRELTVHVEAHGRQWRIQIGDSELVVDAVQLKPGTWSLLLDGRSIVIDVDHSKEPRLYHTHSAQTSIVLESAQRKKLQQQMGKGRATQRRGELIKAPIAGRVVKIQVEVGDEVQAGHCVAILEAMKMENEIRCARAGIVKSVNAAAGDNVDTGASLVALIPIPDEESQDAAS